MHLMDVHFGYRPDVPVVRGISAHIEPGICALIGPNAAGKSTLLKLMLGQLDPQRGKIELAGATVASLPPHVRATKLAYVPQRAMANVAFTVEEVVALGRYAAAPDARAVESALSMCDLLPLRDRQFSQLSAGQQQGVTVARAVAQLGGEAVMDGKVLLLDEPVSAMDIWHAHATMKLLGELAQRGLSVVVVLHDLNLATTYADTIWLMNDGKLAAQGSWEQVMQPTILEPVYRVSLKMQQMDAKERPVFFV